VIVAFTDHWARVIGKTFDAEAFLENVSAHGTHVATICSQTIWRWAPVSDGMIYQWQRAMATYSWADLNTLRLTSCWRRQLSCCAMRGAKKNGCHCRCTPRDLAANIRGERESCRYERSRVELSTNCFRTAIGRRSERLCRLGKRGWIRRIITLTGRRNENYRLGDRHHLKLSRSSSRNSKGEGGWSAPNSISPYRSPRRWRSATLIYKQ